MNLFLMRHGSADPAMSGGNYGLTPQGRSEVRLICAQAAASGIVPKKVWHSPKTRAAETALIALEVWCPDADCRVQEGVLPEDSAEEAVFVINAFAQKHSGEDLLIVSHLPFLPAAVVFLTGGRADPPRFSPGSCYWLEGSGSGFWTTRHFWSPEDFRRVTMA